MYIANTKTESIMNAVGLIVNSLENVAVNDELKQAIVTLNNMKIEYELQQKEAEKHEEMYKNYYNVI